jgi:hypothetical protein
LVGRLWSSDQHKQMPLRAHHTTNIRYELPCPQRYLNPRSKQPSGCRLHLP